MKDAPTSKHAEDLRPKGYSLIVDNIMKEFNGLGNQINIFIIDACRVLSQDDRGIDVSEQVALIGKVPYQTFISFSTSPGATAKDGLKGKNSPFASSLLSHIKEENLDIELLFKQVRIDIKAMGYEQYPWEHTCLIDRFSFNHGQMSKYYDKPYCKEAFVRSLYPTSPDTLDGRIISGIMSDDKNAQRKGYSLLSLEKDNLTDTQKFVIGRYIYAATNGYESGIGFLSTVSYINRFQSINTNHLLRGILYEIFFDEDDNLRERPLGDSNLLSTIEGLRERIKDKDSETFITNELPSDYFKNGYVLGKTPEWKFKVKLSDSELYDEKWTEIKLVEDIIVNNERVLSRIRDTRGNLILTWSELRKKLANQFALPFQKIRVTPSVSSSEKDYKIVLIEALPDIELLLYESCRSETPSEIDALSTLSYIDEVEDYSVSYISLYDDELTVKGNMTVSVHMEYDGEYAGNMSFPGRFSIHLSKDKKDDEWDYSMRKSHIKVNTESFYK